MTNAEEIKKRLDELIKDGINTDYASDCEAIDWIITQLRASLEREERLIAAAKDVSEVHELLRTEVEQFKTGIQNFVCPNCKKLAGPFYPVNLITIMEDLKSDLKLADESYHKLCSKNAKLEKERDDYREALERLDREFIQKYHPGENWFPQTLVITEVLAKYPKESK